MLLTHIIVPRKKDIPVEIGVEQRTDGDIFYVEDFGLGLTEDEATYLFSTYLLQLRVMRMNLLADLD